MSEIKIELWIGQVMDVEELWERMGQTIPEDYERGDFFDDYMYEMIECMDYAYGFDCSLSASNFFEKYVDLDVLKENAKQFEGLDRTSIPEDHDIDGNLIIGKQLSLGVTPSEICSITEKLVEMGLPRSSIGIYYIPDHEFFF